MKNVIIIEFDSDKEQPLSIMKPKDFIQPKTNEEEKVMLLNDISVTFETLRSLIDLAGAKSYANKQSLINTAIKALSNE